MLECYQDGIYYNGQPVQSQFIIGEMVKYERRNKHDFYAHSGNKYGPSDTDYTCCSTPHYSQRVRKVGIDAMEKCVVHEFYTDDKMQILEEGRDAVARLVGCQPDEVMFGNNSTQVSQWFPVLLNLYKHNDAPTILMTDKENPSTERSLCLTGEDGNLIKNDCLSTESEFDRRPREDPQSTRTYTGAGTQYLPTRNLSDAEILARVDKAVCHRTFFIKQCCDAVFASSVQRQDGRRIPLENIAARCQDIRAAMHSKHPYFGFGIDAVHEVGTAKSVNFRETGADFLSFSPPKTLGSSGLGVGVYNLESERVREGIETVNRWAKSKQMKTYYRIPMGMFPKSTGLEKGNTFEQVSHPGIATFIEALRELEEGGFVTGSDCSVLHGYRQALWDRAYERISELQNDGLPIEPIKNEQQSNFIFAARLTCPESPKWGCDLIRKIGNRPPWVPVGHQIAHQLQVHGVYLSYLHSDRYLRFGFHTNNTLEGVDNAVDVIRDVLPRA